MPSASMPIMIAGSLVNFQCLKIKTSANVTPGSCISTAPI